MDCNLVADIQLEHASKITSVLSKDYYVDEQMIVHAIRNSTSFNIIHLQTMFKVDVFVLKKTALAQSAFSRRREETIRLAPELRVCLCSPEDLVLNKLLWFRSGGEVSERQWKDVVGVLKVQGKKLDQEYMMKWAGELGVSDLLSKALGQVE